MRAGHFRRTSPASWKASTYRVSVGAAKGWREGGHKGILPSRATPMPSRL